MAATKRGTTLFDVARHAGVSKSTAARVLAGRGSASAQAVERVKTAARDLGYAPNAIAKAMVSGSSHIIGILVPDVASKFFASVVRGFTDVARAEGFEVMLANTDQTDEAEERSLEAVLEQRVAGIALAPHGRPESPALKHLLRAHTPLIMLDRGAPSAPAVDVVGLDNSAAGRLAAEHLIGLGHKRIGIVGSPTDNLDDLLSGRPGPSVQSTSDLRVRGFVATLHDHCLAPDPRLIIQAPYAPDAAQKVVESALGNTGFDATALFCTDELLSSAAFRALQALGLSCPDDMSFLAFDDQQWCTMVRPQVSVVAQPDYQLGHHAAHNLIGQIRREPAAASPAGLVPELIARGSTASLA